MTLIEVLKTGKRFRRSGDKTTNWFTTKSKFFFTTDDVLDDWEVEELPITLTKGQLWKAWRDCASSGNDHFENFCSLLGIK